MPEYPEVDRAALVELRALARAIQEGAGRTSPLETLADLARRVRLDVGVTIDLEASRELGQPLVVLRMGGDGGGPGLLSDLTPREREVAAAIADGLSNKLIAKRLGIRPATVKDHVHNILRKTGLPNRTAVALARDGQPPSLARGD